MGIPPLVDPAPDLTTEERARYARHILLPDIGVDRAAPAQGCAGARRRRGRSGLSGPPLPRGGRRGHDRHRRRGHRGRLEPAAADRARHTGCRPPQDRVGRRGGGPRQPARARRAPRPAAGLRQRAGGHRRLRRRPRWRRQLPDALPRQRRLRPARQAARVGVDLPLRRAGERVVPRPRPLLPVRLPGTAPARLRSVLRDRRRAGCAVRRGGFRAGLGNHQADCRTRGSARRTPSRPRRAAPVLGHAAGAAQPGLPALRRRPDDHLARRLRGLLRYAGR